VKISETRTKYTGNVCTAKKLIHSFRINRSISALCPIRGTEKEADDAIIRDQVTKQMHVLHPGHRTPETDLPLEISPIVTSGREGERSASDKISRVQEDPSVGKEVPLPSPTRSTEIN
jgi:hypothetical protein